MKAMHIHQLGAGGTLAGRRGGVKSGFVCPILNSFVVRARTRRDTCNSNENATGFDTYLTWGSPSVGLIKPPEENFTPGSLKAVQVSLVKPVAYLKDRVKDSGRWVL